MKSDELYTMALMDSLDVVMSSIIHANCVNFAILFSSLVVCIPQKIINLEPSEIVAKHALERCSEVCIFLSIFCCG